MAPRITLFCSASDGLGPELTAAARSFGRGLAKRGWELIYGGARVGLMGAFADGAIEAGGVVRGAITAGLAATREIPHEGLQELVIVPDLFDRKRWMMENGDAFVIFPGGFGTLDEALEVITWKALGCHEKPILFVNIDGFWQSQLKVFEGLTKSGMIRSGHTGLFEVRDTVDETWMVLDGIFEESVR